MPESHQNKHHWYKYFTRCISCKQLKECRRILGMHGEKSEYKCRTCMIRKK